MHYTLKAALLGVSITLAAPALAQEPVGYWQGTLSTPGGTLPLGVHIERGPGGELSGTLDSPDQQAFDIPLSDIEASGDRLSFHVPAINGRFEAEWQSDAQHWAGSWSQGAAALPLVLTAGKRPDRAPASPRPAMSPPTEWEIPADERIVTLLDQRIAQRPGTGMVAGVIDSGGQRIIARGPSGAAPFDAETIFEIGSLTKVFTGLLLADMAGDGIVSLDDPVVRYLPAGAAVPMRGGQQITLENLSRQDSGLPRLPGNLSPADLRDPYADYTEAQLLEFLANYELPRDIGSEYEYSNLGVGLLGYALARAAGTDFETLVRTRILEPLGMDDTAIALTQAQEARFATGRDEYNRPTLAWNLPVLAGAGALRSTAGDMLRFLQAAMDPRSPLAPAMQMAVGAPREAPGYRAGLGWMLLPAPTGTILMHGGGTGGFRTHMALQPDSRRAVVVLTNSAVEPSANDIALHLLAGAPVAKAGPAPDAPQVVARGETVELTTEQLDRVVGTWRLTPDMHIAISRRGEQLFAAVTGQGALPIFPRTPLEFFWRAVNAEVVFVEEGGRISRAIFTQNGNSTPLTKIE